MAFQKGLGCVHSLSHLLGGLVVNGRLHRGTLNAVVLPAVLRFNECASSVVADKRFARMRCVMNFAADADIAQVVHDMTERLGLPTHLSQMGVERHCHKTNPCEASAEDYRRMLQESF